MVSRRECHQLAALARLSLDEEEAERFAAQLGPILAYLEQLRAVDTTGVAEHLPPAQPGSGLREDVAGPSLPRERALATAPDVREHQVAVPKFMED